MDLLNRDSTASTSTFILIHTTHMPIMKLCELEVIERNGFKPYVLVDIKLIL